MSERVERGGELVDDHGHRLPWVLRLAERPQEARTLVVLHGRGANEAPAKFSSPAWNVIVPLDRYGEGGDGSWWLGEAGDFFVSRLLHTLVRQLRAEIGRDRGLYFWGSSMGGFGAILHGTLLRAHAVYAHIPQIRLRGTASTDGSRKHCYDAVLDGLPQHPYVDLAAFVARRPIDKTPMYFLNQNRFDYRMYIEQHCLHFVAACNAAGHAYQLNIDPLHGHRLYRKVAESVTLFDRFDTEIRRWRAHGNVRAADVKAAP